MRSEPAQSLRGVEVKEKGEREVSRSVSEPGSMGLSFPEGERDGSATVVAGKADWGSGERVERSPLRTVSR